MNSTHPDFKKGDFVEVQPEGAGKTPHFGTCQADSKGGFTIVLLWNTPFLIRNDRISKAS